MIGTCLQRISPADPFSLHRLGKLLIPEGEPLAFSGSQVEILMALSIFYIVTIESLLFPCSIYTTKAHEKGCP